MDLLDWSVLQIILSLKQDEFAVGQTQMSSPPRQEAKSPVLHALPRRIRGQHSKNFKKIKVLSNHYYLDVQKMEKIFIFSVKFTPFIPDDNSKLRTQLLEKVKRRIAEKIKNPIISGKNIFCLSQPKEKDFTLEQDSYQISIKQVKVFEIEKNPRLFLTFMNNALRGSMRNIGYVQIGKTGKYFNSKEKRDIDGLVMYSGFKSSFVQLQKGIFLKVDAAKKIVRNQTVLDFIDHTYMIHKDKDKQDKRMILKQALIGQTVMANYGKTVYHRISDIKFQEMSSITFDTHEGTFSLPEYYRKKYNITINKTKQPLVAVEGRKKEDVLLLIPQLLLMTGIPDDFDEFRRKKISEATIKPPNDKHRQIGELMNKLKNAKQMDELQGMGIKLSRQMEKINAKIIGTPTLELGKKNTVDRGKEAFFNLFNKPIFAAKHKIDMGIIFFKGVQLQYMMNTFSTTSTNISVELTFKKYEISGRPNIPSIEKELENCISNNHNICLIVIPNSLKTQYKQIKIKSIESNEMLTQVMVDSQFSKKGFQSIATKILLQIIAKRGNTLWVPKPICYIESCMLVGYDSAKISKGTLMALCATINSTFSSVFSATRTYHENSEKYNKMAELLLAACNAYFLRNKNCPKQVIVFMNTCPGDQIKLYDDLLITPVKVRLDQAYPNQGIKLTFVMINVKTSERFFLEQNNQIRNVSAGTLVSEDLVSANYDFYLMSQQSNKGTTVPNHYKVIYTNSELDEGQLQELAFSQCFNYVNWTGSIKVPAILQYAKKCAKFNGEVMENKPIPESLTTKLYFI